MKRLLFLLLIPCVAGAQTSPPNPAGPVVMSVNASGSSYFVDAVNGNDSWAGTSPATAWKTVAKVNGSSFSAGDNILFKCGSSFGALTVNSSGTSGNPITFGSYGSGAKPFFTNGSGEGITLNTVSYVTLDGLSTGNNSGSGIYYGGPGAGVIIRNCSSFSNSLVGGYDAGIYVWGGGGGITNCLVTYDTVYGNGYHGIIFTRTVSASTISHCYVHDNSIGPLRGHGISSFSSDASNRVDGCIYEYNEVFNQGHGTTNNGVEGTGIQMDDNTSNAIVRYNKVHDNQGYGLYQNGGTGNVFSYNLVYSNALGGFYGGGTTSAPKMTLYNNTFCGNGGYGTSFGVIFTSAHGIAVMKNNIIAQTATYEFYDYVSGHTTPDTLDNNLFYHPAGGQFLWWNNGSEVGYTSLSAYQSASGQDAHSKSADPMVNSDYTLKLNSPSINAGVAIPGLTTDFAGHSLVGSPDIGAYEYGGIVPAPSFPSGSLTASPDSVAAGGVVTLTWTDSNATSASINNGVGSVSTTGGTKSVTVDTSVTYILTLTNSTGNRTYKASITVRPSQVPLPGGSFTASPDTVAAGGVVTLTWTGSNATSASINNGVGSVSTTGGKKSVTVDASITYILTLTNSAGSRTYKAPVTVLPSQAALPIGSLTASPDTLVTGGVVTLTWTVTNATSASIDNGVGSVPINGGKISVTADTSVKFTLTLTNSAGSRNYKAPITVLAPAKGTSSGPRPVEYALRQNYPNPFNPGTTIRYEVPWASHITITVYDMLGREVSVLVNETKAAGVYEVRLDGSNLASGVYFYLLHAGSFVDSKKLVLLH